MLNHLRIVAPKTPDRSRYSFAKLLQAKSRSPVIVQRVNQPDIKPHRHDFTELVFVLGGTATHEIGNLKYGLKPGDFFLVNNKTMHAYKDCRSLKLINVIIRERVVDQMQSHLSRLGGFKVLSSLGRPGKPLPPPNLSRENQEECLRIVNRIERETFESGAVSDKMKSALVTELLITVCRFAELKSEGTAALYPNMEAALAFICAHYNEPIDIEKLCALAHMSKRSFRRHFEKATGHPPLQYILKARVLKACQLLRESEMPLSEVAGSCGFDDPGYFSRVFKKTTGLSPNAFRKGTTFGIGE
ncbi:MAG: AraC family transcriptional regulator [Lentisphaeria bacterium]|jgi:AraC family L-rhamnose operon transcriptional activator RhaR/AraC family L-rhamnose operon regulatory protein RhaS